MGILASLSGQTVPLIGILVGIWIARKIADYVKLRKFGGPFWTSFSHLPHSKAWFYRRTHDWYAEVSQKYGPIARVAPRILVTSSPDVWTHVNNKPGYKRSVWFYRGCRIEYMRDNVFSETDNEKHDLRRKQMAPGYSGRENLDLENSIDECVQQFLDLVRSKYVSTDDHVKPMDLATKVQFFTMDVISSVGLGNTFGMLKSDSDVDDYLKSTEEGVVILNLGITFNFGWLAQAPYIGKFLAPSAKDTNGFGKMMATCFRFVDERTANPTDKRSDMLASFIRHGLSGDELRSEALEQIIAGADTTAGGIRGTLLHIFSNARVCTKLQQEIDEAVRDGRAPKTGEGIISLSQAKQLPYLQAVIREGLRIFPPVAAILPRDVPPGGDTVVVNGESVFLPGGVCIGYSAYAMHHSEEIYGPDAKVFRPERWFESDPDKLAAMTRTNDLVFGHGKFQCLGKPVAHLELNKIVFELFRNFDVALINPAHAWEAINYLGIFVISDMWVQITERVS